MTPHQSRPAALTRLHRLLAVLGIAVALLVSSAGVASSEVWVTNDAAGDVVAFEYDGESEEMVPAPEQASGDVRRFAVSHTARHVTIRVTMRRQLPKEDWMVFERIKTPRGAFDLMVFRFGFGGGVSLSKANSMREVGCRGLSVKYDANAVQIAVPRRCIGRPSVVRVGAGVSSFTGDDESGRAYADDALRSAVGEYLKLSPPVRRG